MKVRSDINLPKLRESIRWSRERLEVFRANRLDMMRQYVGSHYSEDGSVKNVPVNLINLAIGIWVQEVVPQNPKVLVTSKSPLIAGSGEMMEIAINHLIENEIPFEEELQEWVKDAFFMMGIMKVGIYNARVVELLGVPYDIGQPYAMTVSLDDWVHDMSAKKWSSVAYLGNRSRLPKEDLLKSGLYDEKLLKKIPVSEKETINIDGDEKDDVLSGADGIEDGEYKGMIETWEYTLPAEGLVITDTDDANNQRTEEVLRQEEYQGPESATGSYVTLRLDDVPSQTMPLPPTALWRDLHDIVNMIYRKLGNQAGRQKTNLIFQRGLENDAQKIAESPDGQPVPIDAPGSAQEVDTGGPNQTNFAFGIHATGLFSSHAGNLETLGGLGPQADTLGQEAILDNNSNRKVVSIRNKVIKGARNVVSRVGWFMHSDPLIELPLVKRVEGIDPVEFQFTAEDMEADFLQYNYTIDIMSMQYKSPAARLNAIFSVLERISPYLPFMMESGLEVDWPFIIKHIAKLTNMDEFNHFLSFAGAVQQPVNTESTAAKQSPFTRRENVRVNRPGATQSGKDEAMMQTLLSGDGKQGVQDAQIGSIFRGVG